MGSLGERSRLGPRAARVVAAISVLAAGCNSQGSPDVPLAPLAASAAPSTEFMLSMLPSVGEHTFEWGPGVEPVIVSPRISWSVEFTPPADVSELWIRVRLVTADGTPCWISAERVGRVRSGDRYLAYGDRFLLPEVEPLWRSFCGDRFATETVDVNLLAGPLDSQDEPRVLQGFEFTHFYFFQRVGFTLGDEAS